MPSSDKYGGLYKYINWRQPHYKEEEKQQLPSVESSNRIIIVMIEVRKASADNRALKLQFQACNPIKRGPSSSPSDDADWPQNAKYMWRYLSVP